MFVCSAAHKTKRSCYNKIPTNNEPYAYIILLSLTQLTFNWLIFTVDIIGAHMLEKDLY